MKFQIFCVVWAILLLTSNVSSQTPVCHCNISNIMWSVGSKPVRSNGTIPTSFSRVFFSTNDIICCALWCHLLSLPHHILNIWRRGGLTALDFASRAFESYIYNFNYLQIFHFCGVGYLINYNSPFMGHLNGFLPWGLGSLNSVIFQKFNLLLSGFRGRGVEPWIWPIHQLHLYY